MSDSQCAWVDPSEGRVLLGAQSVTQRIEPPQPHLLGQTSILFNYFWSIEISWFRATTLLPKVCQVVSAHGLIRAEEGGRWGTGQPAHWTPICWVKPQYFSIILKALDSAKPGLQTCLAKYVGYSGINPGGGNWWFWCSSWSALARFFKTSMFNNFLKMQINVVEHPIEIGNRPDWDK